MKHNHQEFKVSGDELIKKVKQLIHEGNIRRIIIKDEEGHTFVEIPLTVGIIGTALLPLWAALGALAALVSNFTIEVIRREDGPEGESETSSDK
jgi:hypothetical protein